MERGKLEFETSTDLLKRVVLKMLFCVCFV